MTLKSTLILVTCLTLLRTVSQAQCTGNGGIKNGSTFVNTTISGGHPWVNPANAQTADAAYASVSVTLSLLSTEVTDYLQATGFGFSIPAGATICGVNVAILHKRLDLLLLGTINDNSVKLVTGGVIGGTEHASGTQWTGTPSTASYGGSNDLWGLTLTPAIVNASNFGVAVSAELGGLLGLVLEAGVDAIQIQITYSTTPLAISLQSFSAIRQGNANQLNWTATSDNQADQFVVQRSGDSKTWQDIATIPVQNNNLDYSYTDNTPLNGTNFYRLFLKNADAQGVYSAIQEISQTAVGVTCYPNPIVNEINISSPVPIHNVTLRDMQGRTIQTVTNNASTNTVQLPAAGLPPGIYLIQVDGKLFKMLKQ
jgi:type IX secretion system substrate protein